MKNKYKVEKKVRNHHKKLKKEANKMKALGIYKKNSKKDVGLPNLYPFKAEVIESLERKRKAAENQKKIEKLKKKQEKKAGSGVDLADAARLAEEYEKNYVEADSEDEYSTNNSTLREKKKFVKELKKVVESSDIILEILDARDPLGCRCKELEAQILGMPGEKKIILVLNKIDLVPQHIADGWLSHLRREYATVLFKGNMQEQGSNLSSNSLYKKTLHGNSDITQELLNSSKAVGADNLLQLIKNYSKKDGIKQAVTVGLVGYPNVGKSTIINSLKRQKAVGVSSVPGYTKNLQEVQIDSGVKLLDCPGIVFSGEGEKSMVLRNIIKPENVVDPVGPIEEILKKVEKNELLVHYKIAEFSDATEFLANIAVSRGKLGKGGVVDLQAAARLVLNDWNAGKIKFFTLPPAKQGAMQLE